MSPRFTSGVQKDDTAREQLLSEISELRARNATLEGYKARVEQLESVLRSGEEMSRQFLEQTLYGVWVNVDNRTVFINNEGARILGASHPRDIIGKSIFEFIHPDYHEAAKARIRMIHETGGPMAVFQEKCIRLDGRTVDVDVWLMKFRYEGKPAIFAAFRDITEHRQAERALKESEEKFRLQADFTYDWESWIGTDGKYVYVSPAAERVTGHTAAEFYQDIELLLKLIHPDDLAAYEDHRRCHYTPGSDPGHIDFRIMTKSGETRWISHLCQSVYGKSGEWMGRRSSNRDITERKRAEESLRESEEKFRVLAETTTAAIVLMRGDRFIYVNPTIERILGYSKDELLTKKYWEVVHPDSRDMMLRRAQIRLEGKPVPSTYEIKFLTKSGESRWGELSAARIEYDGQPTTIATIFDVTERKRIEDALKESESELNKAQRMAHLGNWVWDLVSNKVRGSYELYYMFGLTPDLETPLDQFIEQVAPEDRQRLMNALEETVKHNKPFDIEYQVLLPNGTRRFIQDKAEVSYEDGRPATVFGTVLDTTERKRAEEALKKSESDLNRAQRIAHLGSWEWDLTSNKVRGSDELYRMFGMTPDQETLVQRYIELVVPEDRQRVLEALNATAEKSVPLDIDYQVMLRDGTRQFIHNEAKLIFADGRPAKVFGTVQDVTERKRVENELKAAKLQADLYVDLMSHDISNMNQVGMGFLEMALDMLDLDDMGREMLLKPKSAFENSSKLIDNVKKLQKARSDKYPEMEMDIGQVLGNVRDHYSKQYGPDVTINYLMRSGCLVKANELLYDLFSNIVENAIKHAKAHPMIDINVEPARENGRNYYKVSIDDQGPGIPDELKAVIFERKLTGDIKSKGSGIGLYMVKTLIDIYGGRVWVEDRVKGDRTKGARFVVLLPAIEK